MPHKKIGQKFGILILLLMLIAAFFISFAFGRFSLPVDEVMPILFSKILPIEKSWTDTAEKIVFNIRMPRIIIAILVGSCLSAAGTAYQGVFQNPMASPDILGASAGAAFGAALMILYKGNGPQVTLSAFFFSILTVFLVYIVGERAPGKKVVNLILAGIMIGSLFTSSTSYIKLVADPTNQLPTITYWLMGSLSGANMKSIIFVLPTMLIGLGVLFTLRWRINILTLGDEEALTLGINASSLRFFVVISATLITAASISVSGMIGWIGLVCPHMCRSLVGNDYKYLMPASILLGGTFLLVVDNISRNLMATEIPIGILTAFIGVPFFLYLLMRKEK